MGNDINANPTKEFFIEMLTKDIDLERAIIDLLDNSIDGAKKLNQEDTNESDLYVEIKIDESFFSIKDNCGGFSLHDAQNYAFKFGRSTEDENNPDNRGKVNYSVGRFGVGMKRAIFKMGWKATIYSKHKSDYFKVIIDLDSWIKDVKSWTFTFENIEKESPEYTVLDKHGVYILIEKLNDNVKEEFTSKTFISALQTSIEWGIAFSLEDGIEVRVNKQKLKPRFVHLASGENLTPIYRKLVYEITHDKNQNLLLLENTSTFEKENTVVVEFFVGVDKPDPNSAGWYVYCNDRLVISRNRGVETGWKEDSSSNDEGINKFHNKHAMFRGIVKFSGKNSSLLPMTTTKTGIDSNSAIWKRTLLTMKQMMREVFVLLNKLKNIQIRNNLIDKNNRTSLKLMADKPEKFMSSTFIYPEIKEKEKSKIKITYQMDKQKVERAKEILNVSNNPDVGVRTFNYFFQLECED